MLYISRKYFDILDKIYDQDESIVRTSKEKFSKLLQGAMELEHSTIPSYLAAAYSITGEKKNNKQIRELILRVAKEEMLHMTVIGNLLNAIGIPPKLTSSEFMPEYPFTPSMLDMPDFELHVKSFSNDISKNKEYIKDFFMRIEQPEDPQEYPVKTERMIAAVEKPKTIGLFYAMLIKIIKEDKIPGLFDKAEENKWKQLDATTKKSSGVVDPKFREVDVKGNNTYERYNLQGGYTLAIVDKASAIKFLEWIVDEGEGTTKTDKASAKVVGIPSAGTNPIDIEGLAAHYYRFASIYNGRYLIEDESYNPPFAYSGAFLEFDNSEGEIWEFDTDAKQENYTGRVFRRIENFNKKYSSMLRNLEAAFNAHTKEALLRAYGDAILNMLELPTMAEQIKTEADNAGIKGGLPFQYLP